MTTPPFLTPLVDLVLDEVEATKDAAILEIQTEGAEQVALATEQADRAEAAADDAAQSAAYASGFETPEYASQSAGNAATTPGQIFRVPLGTTPQTFNWYRRLVSGSELVSPLATKAFLESSAGAGAIGLASGGTVEDASIVVPVAKSLANSGAVHAALQEILDNAATISTNDGSTVLVQFPAGSFRIDEMLDIPAGVNVTGCGRDTIIDCSNVDGLTAMIAANVVGTQVTNLRIIGSGKGWQPINANYDPAISADVAAVKADLRLTGNGVVFAKVTKGRVHNVTVENCGGVTGVAPFNGIAGIYLTWGCGDTVVSLCDVSFCRNGINEDNFFGQTPSHNKILFNTVKDCRFGIAADSDANAVNTLIMGNTIGRCQQSGIDLNKANYVKCSYNHTYLCGLQNGNSGIFLYGTGSIPALYNDVSHNTCFGNVGHGIKSGPYAYFNNISNNLCTNNGRDGIFCQGIFRFNTVESNFCQGNEFSGIRIATIQESVVATGTATITGTAITISGLSATVSTGQEVRGVGVVASTNINTISSQSGGTLIGTVDVSQTVGPVAVDVYKDVGQIARTNMISGNSLRQNKQRGILLDGASRTTVSENKVLENSLEALATYDGIALINGSTENDFDQNEVSGTSHRFGVAGVDAASINNSFTNNRIDAGATGRFGFADWRQAWRGNKDDYLTTAGIPVGRFPNGTVIWNNGDRTRYTQLSDGTWAAEPTLDGISALTDADATLTVNSSRPTQVLNVPLTAARSITLAIPATTFQQGARFRIARGAAATGAFNLNVGSGPLKALTAPNQWVDVAYSVPAGAWIVTGSGTL